MDDHDAVSVTINIPKLRKYPIKEVPKPMKNRIIRKIERNPSEVSLRKYSLQRAEPVQLSVIENDSLLNSYTLFLKKQNKLRHKQRLAIGIIEKYKIQYTDLRKRLHIEDPANDVFAVTDIDDEYFRSLNGRQLPHHHTAKFKSLKSIYNQQLRLNYELGCRRDCVINIEVNHRLEEKMYDNAKKNYMKHVQLLDTFIWEDYKNSMKCLKMWEDVKKLVQVKVLELEHLGAQKFTCMSKLIGLDYMYGLQQKYGRFLYYLSPPSWRSRNRDFAQSVEIEARGFDIGASSEEDTFNMIFEKMHNECVSGLIKPPLYFTEPDNLVNILEAMEQQQLHHFAYVTHLAPHAKTLKKDLKLLKEINTADSAILLYMINQFEKRLEFAEEQESQLKSKFFRIINGLFYDSVGAPDVLKFQVHLEFCYEKIYSDKPAGIPMCTIAKALEDSYMSYTFKLDEVHNNKIKNATKQYVELQKMKLNRAKTAARELRLFGRLERSLLSTFSPIDSKKPTVIDESSERNKRKNTRLLSKTFKRKSTLHEISEAEIEYLTMFTEWTKDEDPSKYIHFEHNEETVSKYSK